MKPKTLEIEIHRRLFHYKIQEEFGAEQNGTRRLASESTSVEQGYDFATWTLDWGEISELSGVSIERSAVENSAVLELTMMLEKPGKLVTLPSFSERSKHFQIKFFPFTMEAGAGEEIETEGEADNVEEEDNFRS